MNLRYFLIALSLLLPGPSLGQSLEEMYYSDLNVFNSDIDLPENCVLFARSSVLDSKVKFTCQEGDIYITKLEENLEGILKTSTELELVLNDKVEDFTRIRMSFPPLRNMSIFFVCNDELCIQIISRNIDFANNIFNQISPNLVFAN